MAEARSGDTVRVHYTGRLHDGTVFDSSHGREPLEFALGAGQVIAGFDDAVTGMSPGDSKTVTIPADEAYGSRDDSLVLRLAPQSFPPGLHPEVGQKLQMSQEGGDTFVVSVVEVTDEYVGLDANHPLAGKDLTFDLELVEIV